MLVASALILPLAMIKVVWGDFGFARGSKSLGYLNAYTTNTNQYAPKYNERIECPRGYCSAIPYCLLWCTAITPMRHWYMCKTSLWCFWDPELPGPLHVWEGHTSSHTLRRRCSPHWLSGRSCSPMSCLLGMEIEANQLAIGKTGRNWTHCLSIKQSSLLEGCHRLDEWCIFSYTEPWSAPEHLGGDNGLHSRRSPRHWQGSLALLWVSSLDV